jgi:beta-xylosidase
MTKASRPAGPWSAPLLIKQVKGWIDPCPFWDDDGHAYLINAMSASRSALKSTLIISRMSPDGTRLLDDGTLVYDGHGGDPTVEGPKLDKRNGYYYIFAPAGDAENDTDSAHSGGSGRTAAKVGLYALGTVPISEYGFADIDWFRIE